MKLTPLLRSGFFKLWNKQFLIFLFFLALSAAFWMFQALSEIYEEDFVVPIEVRNLPSNVVVTSDIPTGMQVRLRDKGSQLFSYQYTRKLKPVVIDYNLYSNVHGRAVVLGSELAKQISSQLLSGTQLMTVKPDTIDFIYNFGQCKRVPVIVTGEVKAGRLYTLSKTQLSHDSVTVYASKSQLDTITAAYLSPLLLRNLEDTTQVKLNFLKVRGAKFVPNQINATFCIDRLVEKTVKVPVQQVNFPASRQLRTFPAAVNVTFQVSMGLYRKISSANFVLVINYEELLKNKTSHCRLSLKTIPEGVSHVRISPQEVEYIIEEIPDSESQGDEAEL